MTDVASNVTGIFGVKSVPQKIVSAVYISVIITTFIAASMFFSHHANAKSKLSQLWGNTLVCYLSRIPGYRYHLYITKKRIFISQKYKSSAQNKSDEGQIFGFGKAWKNSYGPSSGSSLARIHKSGISLKSNWIGPASGSTYSIRTNERIIFYKGRWRYTKKQWQKVLYSRAKALVPYSKETMRCKLLQGRVL